jgi:hypothetical protein
MTTDPDPQMLIGLRSYLDLRAGTVRIRLRPFPTGMSVVRPAT